MMLLKPSDIPKIAELVKAGVSDVEIGKEYGTCPQNVMKFRARHGIFRVPWGRQKIKAPIPLPVRQIGQRVTREYGKEVTIRIFSPAWAAGDLEQDIDRDQEEV